MNIFSELLQGDSAAWHDDPFTDAQSRTLTSATYTLTYIIAGPIAAPLSIIAASDGPGWKTTLSAANSATLAPGKYWWSAVLTAAGERITAGSGELIIDINLANAGANYDGRTTAEKALADAESALATFRTTRGRTKKYTIGMRTMEFDSAADILAEISFWRMKVNNEQAADKIAQGLGNPRKMFVRFA